MALTPENQFTSVTPHFTDKGKNTPHVHLSRHRKSNSTRLIAILDKLRVDGNVLIYLGSTEDLQSHCQSRLHAFLIRSGTRARGQPGPFHSASHCGIHQAIRQQQTKGSRFQRHMKSHLNKDTTSPSTYSLNLTENSAKNLEQMNTLNKSPEQHKTSTASPYTSNEQSKIKRKNTSPCKAPLEGIIT